MGKYGLPELNLDLISEPHFIDNDKLLSLSLSPSLLARTYHTGTWMAIRWKYLGELWF